MNAIRIRRFRAAWMLWLALSLSAALAACKEDNVSTGVSTRLGFGATDASGALAAGGSSPMVLLSSGVDVTTFRVGAREIELEQFMDVEVESGVEFEGRFVIDVLAGAEISAMLPAGTYEEVELKLTPLTGVDLNAPATATALVIEGSYNSVTGGGLESFSIRVLTDFELEVEGPDGITIDGGGANLLVMFRLDQMLTTALLDGLRSYAAFGAGSWELVVDAGTALPVFNAVNALVHDALEFGEDRNGDDDLDESEDVDDDSNGI